MARETVKPGQCKVCGSPPHPGRREIDAMLLNGAAYKAIIARMQAAHPGAYDLTEPNLSRHKNRHLLTQPIKTTEIDEETGEEREAYIIGHLASAPMVPKSALPKPTEVVPLPDALGLIINAGLLNIARNPSLVTPPVLMAAIDMARKLGVGGKEVEEFAAAWGALNRAKAKGKRTTTVTVTKEEEVEVRGGPSADIIDVEPEPPEEWSAAELGLLAAPENVEDTE